MLRNEAQPADMRPMGRAIALPLLLIALSVGGFLFTRQSAQGGPTGAAAAQAEAQASRAGAATDFAAAEPVLQAWLADHGTYAGASLPPVYGVSLVRADSTSFCLQARAGRGATHEIGPGGEPQSGPC